jgi:hypothetical protein
MGGLRAYKVAREGPESGGKRAFRGDTCSREVRPTATPTSAVRNGVGGALVVERPAEIGVETHRIPVAVKVSHGVYQRSVLPAANGRVGCQNLAPQRRLASGITSARLPPPQ